jgi:hypothetical protein
MKFRKKPVVIEAFEVGSSRWIPEWLDKAISDNEVVTYAGRLNEPFNSADIRTLEGVMHASSGDWIIRGVKGELYPCKPGIFALTYESVE